MRIAFVSLIICFLSLSAAIAQVDTLQFSEIGSINLTGAITNVFAQDMNGDSFKEIILTTASNVYMYDHSGQTLLWQSPAMHVPRELHFADMNGDSQMDIGVRDDSSVTIFNSLNSSIIWTQQQGVNNCYCFAMGDINSDSINDLVIVTKEPFTRQYIQNNLDTVWVDFYNGPSFSADTGYILLMVNHNYEIPYVWITSYEYPIFVKIANLSYAQVSGKRIILHSKIDNFPYTNTGSIYVNNIDDFQGYTVSNAGFNLANSAYSFGSDSLFISFNEYYYYNHSLGWTDYYYKYYSLSPNSLLQTGFLCHHASGPVGLIGNWRGLTIGEMISNSPGPEFCYSCNDSIFMFLLPDFRLFWRQPLIGLNLNQSAIKINTLSTNPLLLGYINLPRMYQLIIPSNGSLRAIVRDSIAISLIDDLNNDNNDEILSIQGNTLMIYTLIPVTAINDRDCLPKSAFLLANYPNPFNSSTTIRFGLAERGEVKIDIYDILGRKIETLTDGALPAGEHEIVWNAANRSSGLYFYSIKAPGLAQTKRMMLLK